ncbi:MAG: sulfatase [Thermoplasmata archaeon]
MKNNPNIIIIVLDTLRRDVLPNYNGNAITPNIEAFSKESVVFKNPIAPSPWTVPSHMSLFTGLYPGEHNVHEDLDTGDKKALDKIYAYEGKTIVEKMREKGYNTLGFSTNPWLSPNTGFDRGFNSFTFFSSEYMSPDEIAAVDDYKKYGKNRKKAAINLVLNGNFKELLKYYNIHRRILKRKEEVEYPYRKGADLIVNAIMNSSFEEPFFTFINLMEVHEPVSRWELDRDDRIIKYMDITNKSPIPEKLMEQTRNDYKKSLSMADLEIGKLIKHLKSSKLYENSLIIVTSDHGQTMKEPYQYPYYGHGNFLYNEIIEVPMIIKFPGNIKIEQKDGYQNLTGIYKILENAAENEFQDTITETVSFSESFGPVHDLEGLVKDGILPAELDYKDLIHKMFYPKKAVYKTNYKLVINGSDGKVDEFTFKGKQIEVKDNQEIFKDLVNELSIFKGTERFQLP